MLDYESGVELLIINDGKEKGGFMEVEVERINVTIRLKIIPAEKQR